MVRVATLPSATARARDLLASLHVREPAEIDVELIAARSRVLVQYRDLENEEGHLIRGKRHGIIVVDRSAKRSQKWRFVIAHELGHFLCHERVDQFELCTRKDLVSAYRTSTTEAEANDFAGELLMPARFFKPRCDCNRPTLRKVQELVEAFQTSLTATALRFMKFCPEPCAVAYSADGKIEWWDKSDDFRFTLKNGFALPRTTLAGCIHAGRNPTPGAEMVAGDAWSSDSRAMDIEVQEHSMRLGRHGVLTLLWHRYREWDADRGDD